MASKKKSAAPAAAAAPERSDTGKTPANVQRDEQGLPLTQPWRQREKEQRGR